MNDQDLSIQRPVTLWYTIWDESNCAVGDSVRVGTVSCIPRKGEKVYVKDSGGVSVASHIVEMVYWLLGDNLSATVCLRRA